MKKTVLALALSTACAQSHAQQAAPDFGRNLAASCAICHGTNGLNAAGQPDLAGKPRDYLVQQLRDFRDGKRPATVIHQIAKGYTEPQIASLAAYFAAQRGR